jgi:hypothetical protein
VNIAARPNLTSTEIVVAIIASDIASETVADDHAILLTGVDGDENKTGDDDVVDFDIQIAPESLRRENPGVVVKAQSRDIRVREILSDGVMRIDGEIGGENHFREIKNPGNLALRKPPHRRRKYASSCQMAI